MTREEAIETLKNIKAGFETDEWLQDDTKALDMGIQALENQKTGHCKDCNRWKQGKRGNNEDWYSDEGFCNNWRTITGEDFYCADFEVKENKNVSDFCNFTYLCDIYAHC